MKEGVNMIITDKKVYQSNTNQTKVGQCNQCSDCQCSDCVDGDCRES